MHRRVPVSFAILLISIASLHAQRSPARDDGSSLLQHIEANRALKGMMVAAKSIALTTVDLFTDPVHIQKAKAEFDMKRGPDFVYKTRLADRKPALDYRK